MFGITLFSWFFFIVSLIPIFLIAKLCSEFLLLIKGKKIFLFFIIFSLEYVDQLSYLKHFHVCINYRWSY